MKKESRRRILFEGRRLPEETRWLELIPTILPDISETTREWTLDLHYCSGRIRKASSKRVLRCCGELIRAIDGRGDVLFPELAERLPDKNCHAMLQSWKGTLRSISQMAMSKPECTWTSPVTSSDVRKAGKAISFLFDAMAANNPEVEASEERMALKTITHMKGDTQLHVLHRVLDGISSRSRRVGAFGVKPNNR